MGIESEPKHKKIEGVPPPVAEPTIEDRVDLATAVRRALSTIEQTYASDGTIRAQLRSIFEAASTDSPRYLGDLREPSLNVSAIETAAEITKLFALEKNTIVVDPEKARIALEYLGKN